MSDHIPPFSSTEISVLIVQSALLPHDPLLFYFITRLSFSNNIKLNILQKHPPCYPTFLPDFWCVSRFPRGLSPWYPTKPPNLRFFMVTTQIPMIILSSTIFQYLTLPPFLLVSCWFNPHYHPICKCLRISNFSRFNHHCHPIFSAMFLWFISFCFFVWCFCCPMLVPSFWPIPPVFLNTQAEADRRARMEPAV